MSKLNVRHAQYTGVDSVQLMKILLSVISVAQWVHNKAVFQLHPTARKTLKITTDEPGLSYQPASAVQVSERYWDVYVDKWLLSQIQHFKQASAAVRAEAGVEIDLKFKWEIHT